MRSVILESFVHGNRVASSRRKTSYASHIIFFRRSSSKNASSFAALHASMFVFPGLGIDLGGRHQVDLISTSSSLFAISNIKLRAFTIGPFTLSLLLLYVDSPLSSKPRCLISALMYGQLLLSLPWRSSYNARSSALKIYGWKARTTSTSLFFLTFCIRCVILGAKTRTLPNGRKPVLFL